MSDYGTKSTMTTKTIRKITTTTYDGQDHTYEEVYSDDNLQPLEERFGKLQQGEFSHGIFFLVLIMHKNFHTPICSEIQCFFDKT